MHNKKAKKKAAQGASNGESAPQNSSSASSDAYDTSSGEEPTANQGNRPPEKGIKRIFKFFVSKTPPFWQATFSFVLVLIGPKMNITGAQLSLSPAFMVALKNKAITLYFWGWTRYDDIFAESHVTMFCSRLVSVGGGDPTDGSGKFQTLYQSCPTHNCADEECDGQPYGENADVWHSPR